MTTTFQLITDSVNAAAVEWADRVEAGATCMRVSGTGIVQIVVPEGATFEDNILTIDAETIGDKRTRLYIVLSTWDRIVASEEIPVQSTD